MPKTPTIPSTEHLRQLIEAELPDLIGIRHDLHAHPELGYEETRTSGVVQRELKAAGVEFVAGLAKGTGVLGVMPGQHDHSVGLRADMDALPIEERTDVEYASRNAGRMHACGHDGHTTILIGVARVLSRLARETPLPRPVTLVFQPAEEGLAGGKRMVEEGCLNGTRLGPPVESMFGLHGWPSLQVGHVATRPGPMLAAADIFELTIRGGGAHAAYPHLSNDPILAAAAVITGLQQIASRNVDPLDSVVVSVTMIRSGTTHNVIPEEAFLTGTVRSLSPQTHQLAQDRLRDIATRIAAAHGCEGRLDYRLGYPVTRNDPETVRAFNDIASLTLGPDRVEHLANPVMGGEDFSFYGREVPCCFFALGLLPDGQERMPELHQPTFDFNDQAIATGVEVFCRLALGRGAA